MQKPTSYTFAGDAQFQNSMLFRTASREAAFLLAHLQPGMSVLDCGSGPGNITIGIAQAVAPGKVIGVDIQQMSVEAARDLAASEKVDNVGFKVADINHLPFPDATFDAAFAHATIQHLSDQMGALREMRRVLRPGGICAVADGDRQSSFRHPDWPELEQEQELTLRVHEWAGANALYARDLKRMMLDVGFRDVRMGARASCLNREELEERRAHPDSVFRNTARVALEMGWTDEATIERLREKHEEWRQLPEAYLVLVMLEATGRA